MRKTEFSNNGAAPIEAPERHPAVIQDHKRTAPARFDGVDDVSRKETKRSLFRRPGATVAAAALAVVGIGYGAFAMFHSFTHETTDDAFIDVHFVSVAPKIAGRVSVVYMDDNQLVKKGDPLVEIDPRDFQVALAQAKANLAKDKATQIQAATKKSLAVLYNILQQQSSLLSYVYGFRFCVLVCLVCAALALLFKKVGKAAGPVAVH